MVVKTCKACGEAKEAVKGTWVTKRGKPNGLLCLKCAGSKWRELYNTPEGRIKINETTKLSQRRRMLQPDLREKAVSLTAKLRATVDGRSKIRAANLRWARENPDKHAVLNARRRAAKLLRTPPWANLAKIAEFYTTASRMTIETGAVYHVDHVIPLQGELVSGLHVHNNLRVILGVDNSRKRNKFDLEDFNNKLAL